MDYSWKEVTVSCPFVQSVQNEFGYAVEHVYRISPADYWSACKNGSNAQSYVANMDFRVSGI